MLDTNKTILDVPNQATLDAANRKANTQWRWTLGLTASVFMVLVTLNDFSVESLPIKLMVAAVALFILSMTNEIFFPVLKSNEYAFGMVGFHREMDRNMSPRDFNELAEWSAKHPEVKSYCADVEKQGRGLKGIDVCILRSVVGQLNYKKELRGAKQKLQVLVTTTEHHGTEANNP